MTGLLRAYEMLMVAVGALATGENTIQERLHAALSEFHALEPEDFPSDEARHKFAFILEHLNVADSERGHVPESLKELSSREASNLARRVFDLFIDVARARYMEAA